MKEYIEFIRNNKSKHYAKPEIAALGLIGEVGEICDILKKKTIYPNKIEDWDFKILDEMGDVLWQYIALMQSFNLSLDEIIKHNVEKLKNRHGNKPVDLKGGKR